MECKVKYTEIVSSNRGIAQFLAGYNGGNLIKSSINFVGFAIIAILFSACSPISMATGFGASVGVAAVQEGGIKGAIKDSVIQLKIGDAWVKYNFDMYRKLDLTVREGRVLVTGSVPDPDMRVEAIRLVWRVKGVKQVLNEISVDGGGGLTAIVKDTWITSNIKTRLVLDKYVKSVNYNVESSNGVVYLMGVARDQKELNRVINSARNVSHVTNVISYVRLHNEKLKNVNKTASR